MAYTEPTRSVKMWKTRHKISVDIRIFYRVLFCRCDRPVTSEALQLFTGGVGLHLDSRDERGYIGEWMQKEWVQHGGAWDK